MSDPYRGSAVGWLVNVFSVLVIIALLLVVCSR